MFLLCFFFSKDGGVHKKLKYTTYFAYILFIYTTAKSLMMWVGDCKWILDFYSKLQLHVLTFFIRNFVSSILRLTIL